MTQLLGLMTNQRSRLRPTVPVQYVRDMLRHSGLASGCIKRVLEAASLDRHMLDVECLRIDTVRLSRLYWALRKAMRDECFGYLAHPVPPGTYRALVRILTNMRDVRWCTRAMTWLYAPFDENRPLWALEDHHQTTSLVLLLNEGKKAESIFYVHSMLISPWQTLCWLAGRRLPLQGLSIPSRFRPFALQARFLFGMSPKFDSERPQIRLESDLLKAPVVRGGQDADGFLAHSLQSMLDGPPFDSIEEAVRCVLSTTRPLASSGLADVARSLNMSKATLSRRLLAVGLHFQQVKDDVRRDYAISRLQSTRDSLAKIGDDLGYSEPSAFQRAFKSWTGVAPGQFRKRQRC